ncbi:Crp/Fnr family transcriptional regulator [Stackebrandtia soli]|uniref:Crp/Fnr family transcriptional regulator n=1 Tax=Stackebrandtia soli TaxID=1892856 RepID=UPI0039ED49F4
MENIGNDPTTHRGIRTFATPSQWATLRTVGHGKTFQPREPVLRQGDAGSSVVLLLSGRAKVTYAAPDGTEALLSIRGAGDLVGEVACADNEPRTATVWALERLTVRIIPFNEFTGLATEFGWMPMLWNYWADRFRQACSRTWRLANQPPARKLASLFVAMAEAGGGSPVVPMTQEELAESFGLSRRTVGTVLSDWKAEGLITIRRSKVDIRDLERIAAILPSGM